MPGLARAAGWLVGCTLPVVVLAGARAERASPGIPSPSAAVSTPTPTPAVPPPDVLRLAREAIPASAALSVLAARPAAWPSACLGLAPPGAVCAQAVTPGWVVTLGAPGVAPVEVRVGGGVAIPVPGP
jgi:hypothetical protein